MASLSSADDRSECMLAYFRGLLDDRTVTVMTGAVGFTRLERRGIASSELCGAQWADGLRPLLSGREPGRETGREGGSSTRRLDVGRISGSSCIGDGWSATIDSGREMPRAVGGERLCGRGGGSRS